MNAQSTSITIVRKPMMDTDKSSRHISIVADRWQLAKLRWRTTASDGREFGFELEHPLRHGDLVGSNDYGVYVIEQLPENVLVIPLADTAKSAVIAWTIGNLHQPLQVTDAELIMADDSGLRQVFDQQDLHYRMEKRIFQPVHAAASHHHHHHSH